MNKVDALDLMDDVRNDYLSCKQVCRIAMLTFDDITAIDQALLKLITQHWKKSARIIAMAMMELGVGVSYLYYYSQLHDKTVAIFFEKRIIASVS